MMRKIGVGYYKTTPRIRYRINQVLTNNRLSYGPYCQELEQRFAEMHGCKDGVVSNSGTSSLQIALQALKELLLWPDDAEIIVPALTFVASVNAILHNRLKPVLVDVDPHTYNISPHMARHKVTGKTRAIMPVHLFGQPADVTELRTKTTFLDTQFKRPIIEDSCESVLAKHHGKMVGSLGDVGCFSFYVAHHLTAGVGGIAITNNEDLANKMRSLVNHGRVWWAGGDMDIESTESVRRARFVFESVGHSARMTEMEAAVALGQLDALEEDIHRRRRNAAYLKTRLEVFDELQMPVTAYGNTHSFMMFPIVYRGDKWKLCAYLEKHGIETREMLPLTNQPVYKGLFNEDDYPVAKHINNHGFYIGCHPGMGDEDIEYVAKVFKEYFDGCE